MYEKNRKQEESLLLLKSLSNSASSSFAQQQAGDDPFQPLPLKRLSSIQDSLISLHSQGSIHSICKDLLDKETAQIDRFIEHINPITSTDTTSNNNINNNPNRACTSSLDLLDSGFLDGLVRSCDDESFDAAVLPPLAPAHVGSSNSSNCGFPQNVPPSTTSSAAPLPKKDRPHLGLYQFSSIGTIEFPELLIEQEGSGPKKEEAQLASFDEQIKKLLEDGQSEQKEEKNVIAPVVTPTKPKAAKRKRKKVEEEKVFITDAINEHDVLFGQGGESNNNKGNENYRAIVERTRPIYVDATMVEKTVIAQGVVDEIAGKGGRFLKKDDHTQQWYLAGEVAARKKASQALREKHVTAEARAAKRAKYPKQGRGGGSSARNTTSGKQ